MRYLQYLIVFQNMLYLYLVLHLLLYWIWFSFSMITLFVNLECLQKLLVIGTAGFCLDFGKVL